MAHGRSHRQALLALLCLPGRRPGAKRVRKPGQRKPPPSVEAFFTTDLTREAILNQYRDRWAVKIAIRDGHAFAGLGQDQCRKAKRVVGASMLRLVLPAARMLWFVEHAARAAPIDLGRYRPWYCQTVAPSQLAMAWTCRETLHAAGVFPIPRFGLALAENPEEPENTLPLAQ